MPSKRNLSLTLLVVSIILAGCAMPLAIAIDNGASPVTATVVGEDRFGNYVHSITGNDLLDNGYRYGDYVDINFDGYSFKAIFLPNLSCCLPYELGVYSNGEEYLSAFVFNSDLSELVYVPTGTSVLITFDSHSTRMTDYPHLTAGRTTERTPGQTDEDYANFRCVDLNGFKIYRGVQVASNQSDDRKKVADSMYCKYEITHVQNIAQIDHECSVSLEPFRGKGLIDNYIGLYDSGDVECLYCHIDTIRYADNLRPVFQSILEHNDDNICMHCKYGKDRTGFVFLLLECIAGWSVEDMSRDYCASFVNLYGVVEGSREYELLEWDYFGHVLFMMDNPWLAEYSFTIDWEQSIDYEIDTFQAAKDFLLNNVGLTQDEFQRLHDMLNSNV